MHTNCVIKTPSLRNIKVLLQTCGRHLRRRTTFMITALSYIQAMPVYIYINFNRPLQNFVHCNPGDTWGPSCFNRHTLRPVKNHSTQRAPAKYIEAETIWQPFCIWYFQIHFLEWKSLHFDSYLNEICSKSFNSQEASNDSNKGLMPNKRQAIVLINDARIKWCMRICHSVSMS